MAPINAEREKAKQEAARKRKQLLKQLKENKENFNGLALITATKIQTSSLTVNKKEADRQKTDYIIKWVSNVNQARNIAETHWNQPWDWRFVTEKTLHKYIPFEKNISISQAMDHITNNLQRYNPAPKIISSPDEDTPLWNLSRNAIRRALYKASIRRRIIHGSTNLSSVHSNSPVTNLGGEL